MYLLCIFFHVQLYDLMTMAFKYQVLLCPRPKDILLVTFNHMDAIKDFVRDTPSILSQVDETYKQLIEVDCFFCIIIKLLYYFIFYLPNMFIWVEHYLLYLSFRYILCYLVENFN